MAVGDSAGGEGGEARGEAAGTEVGGVVTACFGGAVVGDFTGGGDRTVVDGAFAGLDECGAGDLGVGGAEEALVGGDETLEGGAAVGGLVAVELAGAAAGD